MAYNRTYWVDEVSDPGTGEVFQVGTLLDQENFNNMEGGISDANLASAILGFGYLQARRVSEKNDAETKAEILGESHTVALENTATYPFNSTVDNPKTVALTKNRKNLYYTVEAIVKEANGPVGDIRITDKALNGFKVSYDGSATRVTIELRIKGGMA